ncbi:MAG TPA: bifunctional phosphopantothenoylcysteine decarboxylase/phosphopantothenate--cysteine ligase CoaBC [Gemmatimonadaceae bacterium]|nr:bifunctional phosphopantothenoylcysteine decarboxylase/phosphopantothenate--cysteine ligase CoaBC [Gemmatimonadaceae bacterium]
MRPFEGRRILLGVTGGIASYKTVMLARLLTQAGAEVDVVMTRGALEFVGAITFEAVTGRRTYSEIFGAGNALDHIKLAREAAIFVVAPATADFLARAAHGMADDLLTACLLANTSPVLLVPAMNDRMWANVQTQRNVEHLRELGYDVLDPDTGALAVGEGAGPGRMPEPDTILSEVARRLGRGGSLEGKKIVVTAGATREAIDPVRFISNHSSGRMGVAIAASARRRGAHVTLIAGHLEVPSPSGVERVDASSVRDMREAVRDALNDADVLIMAAAPADFRPVKAADQKIKKTSPLPAIELERAEDILASTIDARRSDALIIGFALETQDLLDNAAKKLADKKLDLIVANDATEEGAGFGVDTNRVTLLSKDGSREDLPLMSKNDLADALLDRIEVMLNGRAR